MSLKTTLAPLGIHEHWNPRLAEVNIVLTEPGQPAPSPDTEITLQHHIFVPGRILDDRVLLPQTDPSLDGLNDVAMLAEEYPSILHMAAELADEIIAAQ